MLIYFCALVIPVGAIADSAVAEISKPVHKDVQVKRGLSHYEKSLYKEISNYLDDNMKKHARSGDYIKIIEGFNKGVINKQDYCSYMIPLWVMKKVAEDFSKGPMEVKTSVNFKVEARKIQTAIETFRFDKKSDVDEPLQRYNLLLEKSPMFKAYHQKRFNLCVGKK